MKALWQILVPCNYNCGKPVKTRHHKEWDRRVRTVSGGLTILPPSKGQWIDKNTGVLYQDRMIPVNLIATDDEMKAIGKMTMKHYKQLAVMYFKLSSETHIIYDENS